MDFPEVRKFILASYHDLPNILFVGSLLLGSLMGYLPLVWMALGLVFTGAANTFVQMLLRLLFKVLPAKVLTDKVKQQFVLSAEDASHKCFVGFQVNMDSTGRPKANSFTNTQSGIFGAPSYWMSAATFFAAFSIYNSIRVTARESSKKVDPLLVSTRRAFSLSTLVIGLVFMMLVFARAFTGCETIASGTLGAALGIGVAIGFWHLLDVCGTGKMPDILQVVGSMAPDHGKAEQPVMCVAPQE
jgi:hypothetical protein